MSGRRFALLIASGRYDDRDLQQLRSPVRDAEDLAAVLRDPRIGDFEVRTVVDGQHAEVSRAIERFFYRRSPQDVLLLHVSCHGIKDDFGELHFAVRDTERELLGSTAVSGSFLHTQMDRCRASMVVLLDCCYSGAFLRGAKGETAVHITEELSGRGRAIITATNRTEYAWEGEQLNKLDPEPSCFTGVVVEGLRSGKADGNRDGLVSVQDLYDYVYERMVDAHRKQTPQFSVRLEHQVVVARSGITATAFPKELADRRLAVGFADIADFTRLTRELEEEELGELVETFQITAADLVAAQGGRLINALGNEVRYATDDVAAAAEIALRLIKTMGNYESTPGLHVGIAFGKVTTRRGHVFGTTVSLASRLRSIAPKGAALVDSAFAEEAIRTGAAPAYEAEAAEAAAEKGSEEPPTYRFALQPMWQRPLSGLGVVEPWSITRQANPCG
ncbi:caspase, EACC1-associated type [Streptomyces virginiae]|uniref:caspase, EACC1-associated type n=1 Tax=Streptomyces virginiae TaxID=1961 RepID=UPI0034552823